jgi:hypothetical protein
MINPEQEFFEFLTTEENLKGLIIAKNQFPSIREKLIENFWKKVLEKVTDRLQNSPEWEAKLESNISHQHAKLYVSAKKSHIYDNKLPSIIFCFQRLTQHCPYIGFWINEQTREYNKDAIKVYIASKYKEHFSEFKGFEDWWLIWDEMTDFNLSIDETLLQIIPSEAEEKAQDFTERLLELFERVKPHLSYINENYR